MNYTITIPCEPVSKGRPRMTKHGHPYTPKKTVDYEHMVQTRLTKIRREENKR